MTRPSPTGPGAGAPRSPLRRSGAPVFWLLFGAGGLLSALLAPVLVFVTGIGVPLGLLPGAALDHAHLLALARHPLGKAALLGWIALLLFHAGHRLLHSLHDLGWRTGAGARWVFYGGAALGSAVAAGLLLAIGW